MSVLLCLAPDLEAELIEVLDKSRPRIVVSRRCADVVEVVAAARARVGTIAVVSADMDGLDLTTVGELRSAGVDLLVVAGARPAAELRSFGVAGVISPNPAEAASEIRRALSNAAVPDEPPPLPATGRLIVVSGPGGSSGRSTIARDLAAVSGALLVDADTRNPSQAQMLALEETSAIIAVARRIDHGQDPQATLEKVTVQVKGGAVLVGLNSGERWRELSRPVMNRMWPVLKRVPWTVADTTGGVGPAERNDRDCAANSALDAADVILEVAPATPIGLRRLIETLTKSDQASRRARRIAVVTGVRPKSVGANPEGQIRDLLREVNVPVVLVSDARPMLDDALLAGRSAMEVAPKSAYVKEIRSLWRAIAEAAEA